jgi:cytochrome c
MNSFELNKILGAILGTCLILLALNLAAGALFNKEEPAKPGYVIQVKAESGEAKPVAKKEVPLPVRLAKASVDKGKSIARQCQVCHTLAKGEPNKIGPNLYNIVGNDRGEDRGGFGFSSAMKAKGGKWTYNELDKFLTDPRGYIPGTLMTFAGIENDQQRADVIDYLHTLSDNPQPLPKAEAQNAPAPAAGGAIKPAEAPKAPAAPAAPAKPAVPSK